VILLQLGQTNNIIVTLAEKATAATDYRFVFKGLNGEEIEKTYTSADDLSTATDRYNKFSIVTSNHFEYPGIYSYKVYDDDDNVLECGVMKLKASEELVIPSFENDDTTYSVYHAE
jgi:hypothetical protein